MKTLLQREDAPPIIKLLIFETRSLKPPLVLVFYIAICAAGAFILLANMILEQRLLILKAVGHRDNPIPVYVLVTETVFEQHIT